MVATEARRSQSGREPSTHDRDSPRSQVTHTSDVQGGKEWQTGGTGLVIPAEALSDGDGDDGTTETSKCPVICIPIIARDHCQERARPNEATVTPLSCDARCSHSLHFNARLLRRGVVCICMLSGLSAVSPGGRSATDSQLERGSVASGPVRMKRAEFKQIANVLLTALCDACKTGSREAVRDAIAAGKSRLRLNLVNKVGPEGLTPLTCAVMAKNVDAVEELLLTGGKVDTPNRDSATPLQHVAMSPDGDEMVSMLIAAGADPDRASFDGFTPVIVAVSEE